MCYGVSLTWGYNPGEGTRYPFEQRWPGVLQHELGGGFPDILLIAPPVLGEGSGLMGLFQQRRGDVAGAARAWDNAPTPGLPVLRLKHVRASQIDGVHFTWTGTCPGAGRQERRHGKSDQRVARAWRVKTVLLQWRGSTS